MPVLSVYVAGVPTTGIEVLTDAVNQAFGECSVEELGRDNLRYKVRTGSKNASVVLIILDSTSMEECKDIEGGLYASSKFYNYTDDVSLVKFLNSIYGLSLEVNDVLLVENTSTDAFASSQNNDDDVQELLEKYNSQLNDKDSIIRTLNATIQELQKVIDEGGYSVDDTELEGYKTENLSLKNRVSDLLREVTALKDDISTRDMTIEELQSSASAVSEKVKSLEASIKSTSQELSQERVLSSQKSGVLRDKEKEIQRLNEEIAGSKTALEDNKKLKATLADAESELRSLRLKIGTLQESISSKDLEIQNLRKDLHAKGDISEQVERYKGLLAKAEEEKANLKQSLDELNEEYAEVAAKHNALVDELEEYDKKYSELSAKFEETDSFLTKVNSDKIALGEELRLLKMSNQYEGGMDSAFQELNDLRRKYAELQLDVFNILSTKALPRSGVKIPLIKGAVGKLNNIRFLFSGNTESRRGTYKCLYNDFLGCPNEKFLIVDVTSETAIDYVFQMKNVVDGMPWFATGGGVQKYLSPTCLPNVKVLMPKLGYVNDSYFLTVNWESRLTELENSGYRVIVYCGDISNVIGRVLLESFSELGNTAVYVNGNALGTRSIIANSSGLSGIKSCLIAYYNFDKNMSRFYNVMSKTCKCRIVSYVR